MMENLKRIDFILLRDEDYSSDVCEQNSIW